MQYHFYRIDPICHSRPVILNLMWVLRLIVLRTPYRGMIQQITLDYIPNCLPPLSRQHVAHVSDMWESLLQSRLFKKGG